MIKILSLAVGLLIIAWSVLAFSSRSTEEKRVVAIGDSLIAGVGSERGGGFISMLSGDLGVPITNLGISGNTTEDVHGRIANIEKYNPDVVILLVGGNDFLRGVEDKKIFENLGKIIDEIKGSEAEVLLLGLENNLIGKSYSESFERLAAEKEIVLVPDVMEEIFKSSGYLADGLHPNDRGYRFMANKVKPYLEQVLR